MAEGDSVGAWGGRGKGLTEPSPVGGLQRTWIERPDSCYGSSRGLKSEAKMWGFVHIGGN